MSGVETGARLLDVGEIARRLDISREDAFDLMFLTKELPVRIEDGIDGVPEDAVEAYRRSHTRS